MKRLKPPRPPRSICGSWLHCMLGIVSPSKLLLAGALPEVTMYMDSLDEYRLATRQMTRKQWRRYIRNKKKEGAAV